MAGCGRDFTFEGDGDDYICGEEFDYDTGENDGCGYLLCPECRTKHDVVHAVSETKHAQNKNEHAKDVNVAKDGGKK